MILVSPSLRVTCLGVLCALDRRSHLEPHPKGATSRARRLLNAYPDVLPSPGEELADQRPQEKVLQVMA